jgi:hypothetical protein
VTSAGSVTETASQIGFLKFRLRIAGQRADGSPAIQAAGQAQDRSGKFADGIGKISRTQGILAMVSLAHGTFASAVSTP